MEAIDSPAGPLMATKFAVDGPAGPVVGGTIGGVTDPSNFFLPVNPPTFESETSSVVSLPVPKT